jgi:hypothetical protein
MMSPVVTKSSGVVRSSLSRPAASLAVRLKGGWLLKLAGDFVYDGSKNRAVAVHSAGMIEGLRKLYGASALADELEGKQ